MTQVKKQIISVVIPCYNEDGNIELLYNKIKSSTENETIEYVFIDDNSSDSTLSVIKKLSEEDSSVKYISFSRNFGHQSALKAGLENATGDCVISIDADLQHPPGIIIALINKWREGYDIVYTIRKDIANTNPLKKVTASLFYRLISRSLKTI